MKKNWYNPELHQGKQPIRVLSENILQWFQNSYPNFPDEVKDEIEYNELKKEIILNTDEKKIEDFAFVNSNKYISIQETYLTYLWIIGYVIFVNYDEVVTKPKIDQSILTQAKSIKYVRDSELLFGYGMSLLKTYKKWNIEELPNPEFYDREENEYIEKMNAVFLSAINFVLIHEYAHVVLGHIDLDTQNIPMDDKEYREQELAADKFAIESLLESDFEKTNLETIKGGILTGLISLVLLDESMRGYTHPDPDDRIKTALEMFNIDETDNLWGVACMGFKQWSRYYKIDLEWPRNVETLKDLFDYNIEKLKSIKNYS